MVTSDVPGSSGASVVRLDKEGNMIVAGVFEKNFTLAGITLQSYGRHDIFLAKFDREHRVQWVEAFGGPGNDFPPDVAVADDGTITLCCDFENMLNLSQRFALYADGHGQGLIRVGPDGSGKEVVEVQCKGGKHEVQINSLVTGSDASVKAVGNFSADTLLVRVFSVDGTEKHRETRTAQGSADLFLLSLAEGAAPVVNAHKEEGSVYGLNNRLATAANGGYLLCGTRPGQLRFAEKDASGSGVYFASLEKDLTAAVARPLTLMCSEPSSLSVDGLCSNGDGGAWLLLGFSGNVRSLDRNENWNSGQGKDALLLRVSADGTIEAAQHYGNGDDLFMKGLVRNGSDQHLFLAGYHHGALSITDGTQLPADGKYNGFVLELHEDLSVRSVHHTAGAGQQFMLGLDAREGQVAVCGTYFQQGIIGNIELPQPGGRFFAVNMNTAVH